MEAGRIVQQGSLEDLRRAPATPFVGSLLDDLDDRENSVGESKGRSQ